MENRKTMKSRMIWLLLSVFLALGMVFGQTLVWAVDTDGDGFTDAEETGGTILGLTLNPNKKDLFVILIRTTPSNIPDPTEYSVPEKDPLQYVRSLPINVHLVTTSQVDPSNAGNRTVCPSCTIPADSTQLQKAVRVSESLETATDPTILGVSFEGTPGGRDNAVVYTDKIKNHVNSVYAGTTPPSGLIYTYIKHTIAHEIGHMIGPLAPVSLRDQERYRGYHYKSGTNVLLDQSVYYTSKGSSVTFYIGITYTELDKAGITLK